MSSTGSPTKSGGGASGNTIRRHMILTGILQGIGCRPTVYRLATSLGLGGWVVNTTSGVRIEIEGTAEQCIAFERDLPAVLPRPGRIDRAIVHDIAPVGEKTFRIDTSVEEALSITPIPPDVAVCPECVKELFTPDNRRYLYPFITCTLCGPRFTVVRSFPYDRERTSMSDFTMCAQCGNEYESPDDRRFHSQTNSCPQCGPRLVLTDARGSETGGDPVVEAIHLLRSGQIVSVKGIGGFHLACDALDRDAVAVLRERKGREEKPFAVMMPDVETVRRYCDVKSVEEELLCSPVSPIVLLKTHGDHQVAPNVAPFMGTLGVMLPYSPIHHLLFKYPEIPRENRPRALVMTSGNLSEEPIVRGNAEALERLSGLADAFLMHNREIVLRADDSIFRVIAGRPTVFRRSRGLVPADLTLDRGPRESETVRSASTFSADETQPVILAAGGDMKNALAVVKGDRAVPGPHVGDLASPVAQDYFKQSVSVLTEYLEADPEVIAVDPHPEYFSNRLARQMDARVVEVFHHHAHAVSLLFEHGLENPVIFAVFDGTGYGTDGTIWGGEFLVADRSSFTREGHFGLFTLPGGEAAIREPIRIMAALLATDGTLPDHFFPLTGTYASHVKFWLEAARKGINSPTTSSAGRLFDAAAAATGFRRSATFEGEAAMWFEGIVDPDESSEYPVKFLSEHPLIVDSAFLIEAVARDVLSGIAPSQVAARFHNSMARTVLSVSEELVRRTGIEVVGLTGGCFQNRFLTERTAALLEASGLRVLLHRDVPPNDGGLALGQAINARSLVLSDRETAAE